jgi:hypothetical protein
MIFLLPLFIIFSCFASQEILGNRFHFAVGLDLFQTQYKKQRYTFDNKSALKNSIDNTISRVAWNISYRITENYPFYIGARTNRGINFPITQSAYDNITKENVRIDIKTVADSVYFATAINKKILPFIITTRFQSHSIIYYNNNTNFSTDNLTIMYGVGMATPLGNKGTLSLTYYLPNKNLNTKRMFGVSVNYFLI